MGLAEICPICQSPRTRFLPEKPRGQTHLVTSPGNFRSFHTPRSKAPPSIGKSDLSTPFRVPTEPGAREILRI